MGIKTKFRKFFFLDEGESGNAGQMDQAPEQGRMQQQPRQQNQTNFQAVPTSAASKDNVVNIKNVPQTAKVALVEPRVYAEAQGITDQLKDRRTVVVNLQRIQRDQAVRIVDFLSGTVYAIGGDIQRIGPSIFLCTPNNVEVDGTISELMEEKEFQDLRWK